MTIFREIAFLLDGPGPYWAVVFLALLPVIAGAFLPALSDFRRPGVGAPARILARPGVFLFSLAIALFAMRWPLLYIPFALNPDESQGIAQALTVLTDPVFYRSVQSGSAGPLWTYPIVLPGLLGLDLNYGTTRFMGILIQWSTLVCLFFAVRLVSGEIPARLATLPGLLSFGLPRIERDFLHYSSEYPALPLLGLACYFFLRLAQKAGRRPARDLFLLGLALGAVPYAKLQGTVIAIAIAVFAGGWVLLDRGVARGVKIKRIAIFVAGGVTVPAFFSLLFLAFGVFGYFWTVYIVNNLHYKERGTPFFKIIMDYVTTPIGFEPVPFVYKILVIAGVGFCLARLLNWTCDRGRRRDHPWLPVAFAATVFAASVYAVAAPGRHFPHYLHFIVLPLCLLCGIFMREPATVEEAQPARGGIGLTNGALIGTMLVVVPFLSLLLHPLFFGPPAFHYPGIGQLAQFAETGPKYPSALITDYKKPGDRLSVWGWHADYYVDTQLPMGTRSAVTEFHLRDVPLREYYRRYYLAEFQRRKPAFFIDAVGPLSHEFKDRELHGHETFPELAEYVAANYVEVTAPDARETLRFFIRRDRADEMGVWKQAQESRQPE